MLDQHEVDHQKMGYQELRNQRIQSLVLKEINNLNDLVKLMKIKSGMLFKNSIKFYITKNKNNSYCATRREKDYLQKNLLSKFRPKIPESSRNWSKIFSMIAYKRSTVSCLIRETEKRLKLTRPK